MKNIKHLKEQVLHYVYLARKNAALIFVLFLLVIYGFLAWRIFQLLQAQPDEATVSSKLQTVGVPKVDPTVVNKMQQLKDNNVNVQTIFNSARSNPFQE